MTRRRVIAIALFVSVALNLFLGGLVIGRHGPFGWHDGPGGPGGWRHGDRAERMERWLTHGLSDEAQPIVRRLIAEHIETVEASRETHHDNRERVRAALRADPFDPAAYESALDAMVVSHTTKRDAMHTLMVKLAGELSVEDRKALADRRRWKSLR